MYLCILRRYVCSEQIRKSTDGNRLSEWRKILFERKQIMAVVCNNKFFAGFCSVRLSAWRRHNCYLHNQPALQVDGPAETAIVFSRSINATHERAVDYLAHE